MLTAVLATIIYYEAFKQEVIQELKTYAHVCKGAFSEGVPGGYIDSLDSGGVRITLISGGGEVVYDNDAEAVSMGNHGDRPEIEEALEHGSGTSIRRSDTMSKNTFYYALRLENGTVLRVSKEAGSIWSIFRSAVPILAGIVFALIGVGLVLTHFLTKSLIAPIEEVAGNLDCPERVTVYKELLPFVNTIKSQHEDILKGARLRQDFTANVSHELKTPLTVISGYAELIKNGMAKGEDTVRFAGEIHRSAQRLLTLINDILKLSELDSGGYSMNPEETDLYSAAQSCADMLELYAAEHGVTVRLEGGSAIVKADKAMLDELLYNLCDNGIRYNSRGGNVWIKVDPGEKSLLVADDGIGISPENQKRIFERFYRVDKSRSRETGGTGLGLAIVKHIVELHNASIEIKSEENAGTSVKVFF